MSRSSRKGLQSIEFAIANCILQKNLQPGLWIRIRIHFHSWIRIQEGKFEEKLKKMHGNWIRIEKNSWIRIRKNEYGSTSLLLTCLEIMVKLFNNKVLMEQLGAGIPREAVPAEEGLGQGES